MHGATRVSPVYLRFNRAKGFRHPMQGTARLPQGESSTTPIQRSDNVTSNSFDLVILGGGTGGYSAALRAGNQGLSVALVEKDKVGGTCLHWGCIPTKALLHAAEVMDGVHEAAERWGIKTTVESIDYSPRSVVVLGAGAVGVEFASFYRSMGAEVTVVEVLPGLVPLEDTDVQRELARAFKKRGITALVETKLEDAKVDDEQVTVTVTGKGGTKQLSAELLLVATGRGPVTRDLGYEDVGVKLDGGFVVPKSWDTLETDVPGVYAVGDILPPPSLALAHASFAEGMLVAELAAGKPSPAIDYYGVPRVTYCTPEVASVCLTEAQAKEQGHEVVVQKFPFNGVAKGMIHGQGGMVKLVGAKDGPVLGVHLVGARVTDLGAESMLIYNWEALPQEVAQFIQPHPTLSEAVGEAYLSLAGRPLHG